MSGKSILFRVDGGRQTGLGHVVRCLELASELNRRNIQSVFFSRSAPELVPVFAKHPIRVYYLGETAGEVTASKAIENHLLRSLAHGLVIDLAPDLKSGEMKAYRELGLPIAALDDHGAAEKHGDLVVNAIAHPDHLSRDNAERQTTFNGAEYIILDPVFSGYTSNAERKNVDRILIAMGGADPHNITLKTLQALDKSSLKQEIHVLLGPVYKYRGAVEEIGKTSSKEIVIHQNLPGDQLPAFIDSFDIAIMSFGISVYAAAHLGVPSVLIAHNDDGARAAWAFTERYGCGIFLGRHDQVQSEEIVSSVERLIENSGMRKKMISRGKASVDGKGLIRVADLLENLINE